MSDGPVSWELDQFFGAYFHQDWVLEAEDWQGIVDSYVDVHPVVAELLDLAAEIDAVVNAHTELGLRQLMDELDVNYLPQPLTHKEWLGQVAERLRLHAHGIAAARRAVDQPSL
ncbi:contact-dependent growth inhibition system immunity protein [[Mycobacterium] wendilense]|uniref:Contact-dependent growth inhibition system immunity protein n=1 Tax=[Mycobacterium] wendilense TaxID=3064284 RepID=A0ABN9NTJ1_9MYCO|nr:contact-dependent growth inhibition system immunity protein [Mycolicibacterium sp. MU0050]CAJ1579247.1 contact-dependent growth inhibition system immunity protein [Mycolicibacterium sp. MU0050]